MRLDRLCTCIAVMAAAVFLPCSGSPSRAGTLTESDLLARAAFVAEVENFSPLGDIEGEALALLDASAARADDKLTLTFASGLTRTYQNKPECKDVKKEADCEQYTLIVHSHAHRAFIILKAYYEGIQYLIVDDTSGEEIVLEAFPIFSPSGSRMLVRVINHGVLGFQVQLWKRDNDRFVSEWTGEPFFTGQYLVYDFVGWREEDVIDLRANENPNSIEPNIVTPFQLRHTSEGWRIARQR